MQRQLLAFVVTVSVGLATVAQGANAMQQTAANTLYTVEASSRTPTLVIGGSVVPYKEVTLSAQLAGRIKFIAGIEGDAFEQGALLLALDESELMAKRNAAYAQLSAADAQVRNAGVQHTREIWSPKSKSSMGGMALPNLFDQMFTRPAEDMMGVRDRDAERGADLFASSTRMQQARSAMMQAQSEIHAIDAKIRDAKSMAPFSGMIMEKFVEEGDTVQPGQPMLKIADVAWLQIEVDLPARLVAGLEEMMILKQAARFDDYPDPVDVRVAQIYPMADVRRHTIKVKFDIPQNVTQPGMYAKVKIPDTSEAAAQSRLPAIPTSAIRYRGSLPVVYIQGTEGAPELRLIREGKRLDNGMTTVLSGLAPGDKVFSNPGPDIMAGH